MKTRTDSGFTLVETIVAVAMTGIVMATLGVMIQYFYQTNAYALEQNQAVNSARASIENTVRDLREACYGADGSYPVNSAATSSVVFYARSPASGTIERLHYYLSGQTLYRGTTDPGGTPLSYSGQPERATLVIDNIRNDASTPLFTYYDTSGNQLPDPVNVASVASVRIQALTDVNPDRAPNVYTMLGSATLRNLHDALP